MINLVILEGELVRAPFVGKTPKGAKKVSFTIKTDQYIEVDAFGKNAELLENCTGGEKVHITGSLKKYKSNKYNCYMLSVNADKVELLDSKYTPSERIEEKNEESEPEITYEVSFDDLPF